jgi:hypothetical protein
MKTTYELQASGCIIARGEVDGEPFISQIMPGTAGYEKALAEASVVVDLSRQLEKVEQYVARFFTVGQLQHMAVLLTQQNGRSDANYTWISEIIQSALNGDLSFEGHGEPPYSYLQVISQ